MMGWMRREERIVVEERRAGRIYGGGRYRLWECRRWTRHWGLDIR